MIFVALLILVAVVKANLECPVSDRFPWMINPLSLKSPWSNYKYPNNKCCDVSNPGISIDFNVACTTLPGFMHSFPRYIMDPNNCQKLYMCIPNSEDGFDVHSFTCPNCMFWDSNVLSCIEVDSNCNVITEMPLPVVFTGVVSNPVIRCIDFENSNDLSTEGMYVLNNGVTVVQNGVDVETGFCPEGNNCGLFDFSLLEIPFFTKNYKNLPNLKITFSLYSTGSSEEEFIISNDCEHNIAGSKGNSIFYSILNGISRVGSTDSTGNAKTCSSPVSTDEWKDITIDINATHLNLFVDTTIVTESLAIPYNGMGVSHCPLIIGASLNSGSKHFFHGFIDNVCFSIYYY